MHAPLVSIALCTYNGAKHLDEQLSSLVNQTYPNLEIVVADDCSSDETMAIIAAWQKQYPIRFFQNEENLGYVKNFENVIRHCEGEYIALADQDDIWDQDKIGLMVNGIGNNAMIYHDSEMVDENGDALNRKISDMYNMYSGDQPYAFFFSNTASGHALMFHNRLTPHILPFNNQFYHDWLIAIVATVHGGVKYLDKPLVKYRQHQRSTTDILNFRDDPVEQYKSIFNPYSLSFLAFAGPRLKRHAAYIRAFLSCFDSEQQITRPFKLFILLLRKYHLLLYRMKKSGLSKINYIRRASLSKV